MNSLLRILTVGILLIVSGCGSPPNQSKTSVSVKSERIINGTLLDNNTSPQFVRIFTKYNDGNSGFCTGTVIAPETILSAGHCFTDPRFSGNPQLVFVIDNNGVVNTSAQIAIHPGYFPNTELNAIFFDAAILKVPNLNLPALPILYSKNVQASDQIGIYGFGSDENQVAGLLRSGTMTVDLVTPNHIFASFNSQSNTCNGDSGGPATLSSFDEAGNLLAVGIVGITSSGSLENCAQGDVSLFTNVQTPEIINFIISQAPGAVVM